MAGTGTERASGDCTSHEIVTVSEVPGKGRGLVSAGRIPKDAVILKEPVIIIDDPEEIGLLERSTTLKRYLVYWDGRAVCIPLGLITLINHSRSERLRNVTTSYDHENKYITVSATRDIDPGEELLFDYGVEDSVLVEEYGIPSDS